jgi:hypothetical protein
MAQRRQIRESRSLEGGGERPAMGYGESEAVLGALRYEAVVPVVRAGAGSARAVR